MDRFYALSGNRGCVYETYLIVYECGSICLTQTIDEYDIEALRTGFLKQIVRLSDLKYMCTEDGEWRNITIINHAKPEEEIEECSLCGRRIVADSGTTEVQNRLCIKERLA